MLRFASIIFLSLFTVFANFAQQRPLLTEDVDTTPEGSFEIAAGVDFLQDNRFPLSGFRGDQTRIGDVRISVGFSKNVEFQIEGVVQNYVAINELETIGGIPTLVTGNSTNDTGDFVISTKIRLRNETKRIPAVGFKAGFQMPNSNESRGIGTNQINIFGLVLVQKRFGSRKNNVSRLNIFGNLGMSIMNAPLEPFTQNDVVLYGLGGIYRATDSVNIVAEVNGRANTRTSEIPVGTESVGQFRVGAQFKTGALRFDSAAIIGLTRFSPRTGVTFGVTYTSPKIFTPAQ